MIRVRCPICGKSLEIGSLSELPSFPFCTDRCRLLDLGRWIDGNYVIPGAGLPEDQDEAEDRPDASADFEE